jgi:hypothetical protein
MSLSLERKREPRVPAADELIKKCKLVLGGSIDVVLADRAANETIRGWAANQMDVKYCTSSTPS